MTTPETTSPASPSPASTHEATPDMMAEMEAQMQKAMAAPAPEPKVAPAPKPAIRGPRVVQAGREHRHGKVVSVGPTDIFLEFGPKELGVLPRAQFPEEKDLPVVGTEYEVVIDKFEASENYFVCSRPGMVQKADWEMLEAGQVVEARVTGVVTGKEGKPAGLELEVAGHRAFMPASQASIDRVPDLSVFVGEKLKCQVARVERMGKGNIVLSRRDILDAERKENAEKVRATLTEGQTLEGTVRKIMPFGVFVDIGGLDGLVHISDVTYDRVGFGEKAIGKYVKEGQRVNVRVLKIDDENKRISLGLKQVAGDPFATAANTLAEGAEVTGKVTRLAEFGAFVELAPGVDGLVHISEIDWKRIGKVEDALKQDEIIRAKILKIDPQNRRISLSIKALKPMPEAPAPKQEEGGEGRPQGGGGRGFGGGGFGGGRGGFGGRAKDKIQGRTAEEILKETPALRRAREKNKQIQFKGGLG
ncbi:MAG: S1 RNA-binding domain-containing protein [Phycisphaerales bacterium]